MDGLDSHLKEIKKERELKLPFFIFIHMVYEVIDVPLNGPCENCIPCMRLKLMEFGFIPGQDIEIHKKQWGLYVINMISKQGHIEQTVAVREEEFSRISLRGRN